GDLQFAARVGVDGVPVVVRGRVVGGRAGDDDRGVRGGELLSQGRQSSVVAVDDRVGRPVVLGTPHRGDLAEHDADVAFGEPGGSNDAAGPVEHFGCAGAAHDVVDADEEEQVVRVGVDDFPADAFRDFRRGGSPHARVVGVEISGIAVVAGAV